MDGLGSLRLFFLDLDRVDDRLRLVDREDRLVVFFFAIAQMFLFFGKV